MKKVILVFLLSSAIQCLMAQDFSPGWFIIKPGATYAVLFPSYHDCFESESYEIAIPDFSTLAMGVHEAVLAFAFSKDKYYCFDPNGRMVVIKGVNSLEKATTSPYGVVLLNETITLPGGEDELGEGSYFWCVNDEEEYITIQLAGGMPPYKIKKNKTQDGLDKVEYHTGAIKRYMKNSESFVPVQE